MGAFPVSTWHPGVPAYGVTTDTVVPMVIGSSQLYLNRSQSAGACVKEFVSLNNSSTPTILPLNGGAPTTFHGCERVTIVNASTTVDTFHVVRYAKVTTGNGSGTAVTGNPFEVGGSTGLTPVGAAYSNWSVVYALARTGWRGRRT